MSQVIRKFQNSGKIEQSKPELFERSGVGKYNKTDLVSGLYRNIDTYIKNNNLSGDKATSFRDSANQFIKGLESGTITMNGDGTFADSTGSMSSTGKFEKNWIGKTKNTTNNAFNLVGNYAQDYISQMPQYKESAPTPKAKFKTNDFFGKEVSKAWYGGNQVDKENWFKNRGENDRTALLANIANTADYNKLFNDYDWTDTGVDSAETLANRFKGFSTAISNNKLDNEDYNSFATLGGSNLDEWFKQDVKPVVPEEDTWRQEAKDAGYTSDEDVTAYLKLKRDQKAKASESLRTAAYAEDEQKKSNAELEQGMRTFETLGTSNWKREGSILPQLTYNPAVVDTYRKTLPDIRKMFVDYDTAPVGLPEKIYDVKQGKGVYPATTGTTLVNNLDYYVKQNTKDGAVGLEGDPENSGAYIIPESFDPDKGTIRSYNPNTRTVYTVPAYKTQYGKETWTNWYKASKEKPSGPTWSRKEGGILMGQQGMTLSDYYNQSYKDQHRKKQQEFESKRKTETVQQEQEKAQKAAASGKTPEQQKAAERVPSDTGWTGTDYTRMGAIVADIGSMAAAYVPGYGTIASAGLGVGSTLANFGADWAEDGLDWGDAGNLAMNLGLDVVGLVPGLGSGAKGSKMLKSALKYIPRALTALAAANYTGPAVDSMSKAIKGEKLSVDDWKNIGEGLKLVIQGGKGIKRTVQGKMIQNQTRTGNKVLTTKSGEDVTLTPSQLDEIRSHRKFDDQQAALQLVTGKDNLGLAGDLNKRWYNPTKYMPNSNLRDDFDFNKTKTVRTSTGNKEVPIIYSGSDKAIAASMQQNVLNIPGVDKALLKYNDWKYGKSKPIVDTPQPSKPTSKPTPVEKRELGRDRFDKTVAKGEQQRTIDAWRKRYPKKLGSKSDSEILAIIEEQRKASKFQDGGIIFLQDGKAVRRNVASAPDVNWGKDVYGSQGFLDTLSGIDIKNYSKYNDMQNAYPSLGFTADKPGDSVGYNKNVANYQNTFNTLTGINKGTISGLVSSGRVTGRGGSSDKGTTWSADGLPGTQTWLRHLGTDKTTDASKLGEMNSILGKKGVEAYYNNNGMVNYRMAQLKPTGIPIPQASMPTKISTPTSTPVAKQAPPSKSTITGAEKTKRNLNFNVMPEDALALGRMVGGLATNNRAAKIYKEGLKPTLLDTFENTVPLQGNFQAKSIAQQEAGNLESMAARPRTSDASLQLAGELEASGRAGAIRQQGDMQDAERFYQTRMLGQQESDAAKARRVQTANQNRGSMNAIDAAKKQIDSARVTANYQQVVAPYMAGVENQFRQNSAMKKQLDMEQAQNNMATEYDDAYASLMERYKDNPVMLNQEVSKLRNKATQDMLSYKKQIFGNPWLFGKAPSTTSKIPYSAKGSKLSYREKAMLQRSKDFNKRLSDDNKLMHRDIMEAKREHNKLIMNMSSLTASLIKRGMNL